MDFKEFGFDKVMILPPMKGTCPECAAKHEPDWPHNRDSLYYQIRFYQKNGRMPTWGDAMAHCSEDMKRVCREVLTKHGVKTEELEPGQ